MDRQGVYITPLCPVHLSIDSLSRCLSAPSINDKRMIISKTSGDKGNDYRMPKLW